VLAALALALALSAAPPLTERGAPSGPELVYCGDQEGGGPFIYPSPEDPRRLIGSDVDVAEALARRLGRPLRFQQGAWDRLPELVLARKCDLIINGYERTPARARVLAASLPYQVYALAFLARIDAPPELRLEALRPRTATTTGARRWRIGALTGSSADTWLRTYTGAHVDVVTYDGNTDAMREVETGKLDGTLQDTPIAAFYGPRFPALEVRGAPVEPGYYVVYARPDDRALVEAIDRALLSMIHNGELAQLLGRYGTWDPLQAELASIAAHAELFGVESVEPEPSPAPSGDTRTTTTAVRVGERPRGLEVARRYGGILLESAGLTVILSVLSFPLAVALGLLVALGRAYGPRPLGLLLGGYVEVLRGTPLMLQLYALFFLLPELGVALPAFATAIIGLAVNYSAYEAEIHRAGLQAVPPGQLEAALSLGMTRAQALRRVVVPQALRTVIPPVMNDFIALFKDTSVCSVVTLIELTKRFSVLSQSTQATVELMVLTALLYLLMSWPASAAARAVERSLAREAAP
jgi:polar amino acid transport system substrate-binding protein